MNKKKIRSLLSNIGILCVSAFLAGCPCPACDLLMCGDGTIETVSGETRTCVVAPVACGEGTMEQMMGGQRECVPEDPDGILECGADTYQQEQTFGGQRECTPGMSSCPAGEIEYLDKDSNKMCRPIDTVCGEGTFEQTFGGQRECVPDDTGLSCGSGTSEVDGQCEVM